MTVTTLTEVRSLRPSQVVAEALVERQAPNQIVARARQLGYSNSLTNAVVHACCGDNNHKRTTSASRPKIASTNSDLHSAS
jgi:hypothetical protein